MRTSWPDKIHLVRPPSGSEFKIAAPIAVCSALKVVFSGCILCVDQKEGLGLVSRSLKKKNGLNFEWSSIPSMSPTVCFALKNPVWIGNSKRLFLTHVLHFSADPRNWHSLSRTFCFFFLYFIYYYYFAAEFCFKGVLREFYKPIFVPFTMWQELA